MLFEPSFLAVFGPTILLVLRIILGQIFLVHGAKKIMRKEALGTPPYIFLGVVEALAGFGIIVGFRYQAAALVFVITMIGAIITKLFYWKNQSYISNIEYDVLILVCALVILVYGPGIFALNF